MVELLQISETVGGERTVSGVRATSDGYTCSGSFYGAALIKRFVGSSYHQSQAVQSPGRIARSPNSEELR
jgi:hypothetical protein